MRPSRRTRGLPATRPPARAARLPLLLLLPLAVAGCGENAPPPPELPGIEVPRGPTELTVTLTLTFTRDESPVQVPRRVTLSLPADTPTDQGLLAEVALQGLLEGPTPAEEEEGVFSFFSAETAHLLDRVEVTGDSALVVFHDLASVIPNASTSAGSFQLLTELNGTLFALPGIGRVEYRMNGSCEAFWNFLQRDCQVVERPASA